MTTDAHPPLKSPTLKSRGPSTVDYLAAEAKLTPEEKAVLASHLAAGLGGAGAAAGGEAFVEAEAVLRLMTWNAEPRVVEAMARAAAANPHTPRSLAWALANDDEAAATLVLEACAALSDADLVSLVQGGENAAKICAIARRPAVSAEVSRSLVGHGNEDAVHTLLANAKAEIPDDAFGTALDRFGQSKRIQEGIIDRPSMSAPVARRLSASLSPELREKLAGKFAALTPPSAALPGYVEECSDAEWEAHLAPMIADRSLNETTLVRQLSLGNLEFFARALSILSGAPYAEIRAGLLAAPPAFAPFWQSALLPTGWLPVAAAAVTALIQVDHSAGKADRELFSRNIINRTLANLKAAKITLTDAQRRLFARPGFR